MYYTPILYTCFAHTEKMSAGRQTQTGQFLDLKQEEKKTEEERVGLEQLKQENEERDS